MKKLNLSRMRTEIIPLKGGVDSVTTPVEVSPGKLLSAYNFEPDIYGGYRRMAGIERFDGRPRPSDASYWIMEVEETGEFSVNDTITGETSSTTAVVVDIVRTSGGSGSGYGFFDILTLIGVSLGGKSPGLTLLILAKVNGLFSPGENISVSSVVEGVFSDIDKDSAETGVLHAKYKNLAADATRQDIGKPPGSGPIRGVWYYKGNIYCFRDNVGGTQCFMFKALNTGWQLINFGVELQFKGAVGEIKEGDTITGATSSATGVVKRALLRTGTWTASGEGTLVFDSITGTFLDNESLHVSSTPKAIADGSNSDVTLLPGGKFEFDNYNFSGTSETLRMYCADGVNHIGEFDGQTWVPIRTGIGDQYRPKFIKGHKQHLIVGIESSIQVSSIGDPYSWTALTGAAELGLGEECTGILPQVGDASVGVLIVSTKSRIFILYGNDINDFNLVLHAPETGAYPYTLQNIGSAHFMDAKGVMQMHAAQEFGGFQLAVLTKAMQPFMDSKKASETASCIVRKTNQYRIFFNDGDGLIVYFYPGRNGMEVSLMPFNYDIGFYINQVCSFVDDFGNERIIAAGSNGMVYELDRGTSHDGEVISAHMMMTFVHSKSARLRKRYKRTILQFRAGNTARVAVGYDLSYGNLDPSYPDSMQISKVMQKSANESGGYWGSFNWDNFTWDSSYLQEINVDTPGVGESMSILVTNETDEDEPFTIHTCMLHYFDGRLNR